MIPTRTLVGLFGLPLLLGVLAVFLPQLVTPMLAIDVVLVCVAVADALRSGTRLEVRREVGSVQAVGRDFEVHLVIVNRGTQVQTVRVLDAAPEFDGGHEGRLELLALCETSFSYTTRVDQRGHHVFGPVSVRVRSPWGLWERQQRHSIPTELRVYPDFAQLRNKGLNSRLTVQRVSTRVQRRTGGENEFERLRPYVAGDSYRHIDWKATAKRREFITREFRQESNQNLILMLDCGRMMGARCGDLTAFDHALNAAVLLGQTALRHGDRVGLMAFDSEVRTWLPPRSGVRSGGRLIRGIYDRFPSMDEPDYAKAFRFLAQRVRRRSLVVVMTHVVDEVNAKSVEAVVGAMARRHLTLNVWLRDPALDEILEAPATTDLERYHRGAVAEVVAERESGLARLSRRGALIVDCPPRVLTGNLLTQYLEVKSRRLL